MRSLLLTVLLMLAASDVAAQQPQRQLCAPRDRLIERMAQEFGEVPIGGGIDGAGNLIELLTSPSGTWTLLTVMPNKMACFSGSGEGWRDYEPTVPGRPA